MTSFFPRRLCFPVLACTFIFVSSSSNAAGRLLQNNIASARESYPASLEQWSGTDQKPEASMFRVGKRRFLRVENPYLGARLEICGLDGVRVVTQTLKRGSNTVALSTGILNCEEPLLVSVTSGENTYRTLIGAGNRARESTSVFAN